MKTLDEATISELLADQKQLSIKQIDKLKKPKPRQRDKHLYAKVQIKSASKRRFVIQVRKNPAIGQEMDFAIMLYYMAPKSCLYHLIRLDGWHDAHTNKIERTRVPENTCHIHRMTERYQNFGKPDGFAVESDDFSCFQSAVEYMCFSFGCWPKNHRYNQRFPLFGGDSI